MYEIRYKDRVFYSNDGRIWNNSPRWIWLFSDDWYLVYARNTGEAVHRIGAD